MPNCSVMVSPSFSLSVASSRISKLIDLLLHRHELLLLQVEQVRELSMKLAQGPRLRLARGGCGSRRRRRRVRHGKGQGAVARQLQRVELEHHHQRRQAQPKLHERAAEDFRFVGEAVRHISHPTHRNGRCHLTISLTERKCSLLDSWCPVMTPYVTVFSSGSISRIAPMSIAVCRSLPHLLRSHVPSFRSKCCR